MIVFVVCYYRTRLHRAGRALKKRQETSKPVDLLLPHLAQNKPSPILIPGLLMLLLYDGRERDGLWTEARVMRSRSSKRMRNML